MSLPNGGFERLGCRAETWSGGCGSSGSNQQWCGHGAGTGDISNWGSGRLTNSAGASLDVSFNNGTFINQGTLTKSAGATDEKTVISGTFENPRLGQRAARRTASVHCPFDNRARINVSAGAVFYGSNPNFPTTVYAG